MESTRIEFDGLVVVWEPTKRHPGFRLTAADCSTDGWVFWGGENWLVVGGYPLPPGAEGWGGPDEDVLSLGRSPVLEWVRDHGVAICKHAAQRAEVDRRLHAALGVTSASGEALIDMLQAAWDHAPEMADALRLSDADRRALAAYMAREAGLSARESALAQRETALALRESALAVREAEGFFSALQPGAARRRGGRS